MYLSFAHDDLVAVLDANSGRLIHQMTRTAPGPLAPVNMFDIALCGISSNGTTVVAEFGDKVFPPLAAKEIIQVANAAAIAADKAGNIYVGTREPDNQVRVYSHTTWDSSGMKWELRKNETQSRTCRLDIHGHRFTVIPDAPE